MGTALQGIDAAAKDVEYKDVLEEDSVTVFINEEIAQLLHKGIVENLQRILIKALESMTSLLWSICMAESTRSITL